MMARMLRNAVRYEDDRFVSVDDRVIAFEASVDEQGGEIRDKPVFNKDEAAFYLNRGDPDGEGGFIPNTGAQWAGAKGGVNGIFDAIPEGYVEGEPLDELAFGFYESRADLPEPYYYEYQGSRYAYYPHGVGFSPFDAEQRVAARQALQTWDELIDLAFVETASADADINFMNTTTGPIQAAAFLPYNYAPAGTLPDGNVVEQAELAGDVSINPNQESNHQFDEGQYGLNTLIHELGHALGLKHPGDYNFSADFAATYENGAEYYQDSGQYTIMSYWDAEETGAARVDWEFLTYNYASTPLVHDIAAIQRIYGADMTTRTGDDVYGFNSNIGLDAFNFEATPNPVIAIWDAGGTDTLDLSGYDTPSIINLNEGQFSSAGGFLSADIPTLEEINARRTAAGLEARTQATYDLYLSFFAGSYTNGLMRDNISIAYGVTIENAAGGSGDDIIYANAVANEIDGGDGLDTVSYLYADSRVEASLRGGSDGAAEGDRFNSVEALEGSNFGDGLNGGNADDIIRGLGGNDIIEGGNGDDLLDGGEGNDRLEGGNSRDTLTGGAGHDLLEGGNSSDVVSGGDGNDTLRGGTSADVLNGGAGDDTLDGGNSSDVLNGGAGSDTLDGGNGRDIYLFEDAGTDTIIDYERGEKIDLTALLGVDRDDVEVSGDEIFVDLAGDADLTIVVEGDSVRMSDILFAPDVTANVGGGSAYQFEVMIV